MSSICPTIMVDPEGEVRLAIGAAGGAKITNAVAMVATYHLWGGMSLDR